MCRLKVSGAQIPDFRHVEGLCTKALDVDELNVKALYRRGLARTQVGIDLRVQYSKTSALAETENAVPVALPCSCTNS